MPLTNISLADANEYAAWLTTTTDFEYRLPSVAEWSYAVKAPGTDQPPKNYNCQVRSGGELTKGKELLDVRTGEPNGWGLQNAIGNAQEWATGPGGSVAMGGSIGDPHSNCDVSMQKNHNGQADAVTGFRLVREVYGETS